MTAPREHRIVLRYFRLIIALVAVSASLLLISVYGRYASENAARNRVEQLHLRTLRLSSEISTRLPILRQAWSSAEIARPSAPSGGGEDLKSGRKVSSALHSIGQALDSIAELQDQIEGVAFQGAIERARGRFDGIREAIETGAPTAVQHEQLDVFELGIFQLDRLHSIAAEQLLKEITFAGARRARALAAGAAVVLVATGVFVWRLLTLLRARLKQYESTREALLKKERLLMQSQKMEALGALVGGVAHDFNNMLTAILGHAELLLDDMPESDPRRADLIEIRKAGESAAGLTRRLLAFSRADVAELRVVDLNPFIGDMEPLLRRLIRADISLIVEGGEDPCLVKVDDVQMEQILINLAMNASDAMPQGGTLSIRSSNIRVELADLLLPIPAGSYVRISVRDTGHGMRPDVRSRVFEPFFTTKEKGKGTGLGLSTVHGIVTKSQGYVFVESDRGSGTTFEIYLPRISEAEVPAGVDGPNTAAPRGVETVLLVEDEDQVREFTAAALRSAGYRVVVAANGADALRQCSTHGDTIHLILSDVVMPQMKGPELVERIRAQFPDITVVFMSGYSEEDILKSVRESGSPLVAKPFKPNHLLQVVRRELDKPGQRGQRGRFAENA